MSKNVKNYKIEIIENDGKLDFISNIEEGSKSKVEISSSDDRYEMTLFFDEYVEVLITTEIIIEPFVKFKIVDNSKIIELIFRGLFNQIEIKGDCSSLYFTGGCDYFDVNINTNNLPKVTINMAAVHNMNLINYSHNTVLYMSISPSLHKLFTNQNEIYAYIYEGYKNAKNTEVLSPTKLYFIELDCEKVKLDF